MLTPALIVTTLTQMHLCGKRQQGLWVGSKQARDLDFPLQGVGRAVLLITS
jgi:hypothetical protein